MAIGKNLGANSQSSNDFLAPLAPVIDSAVNVGTDRPFNDGSVSIAISLPAGSPEATSYTVTASSGEIGTSASSPVIVTGLSSTSTPTFTAIASNAAGDSIASEPSSSILVTTVPAAPAAPSVTSPATSNGTNQPGQTYDVVSWTEPSNGGTSITSYEWTSSDGKSGTTTSLSANVTQEGNTSQTYQIKAINANGESIPSDSSASITTFSFTPFSFVPFNAFGFVPFGFVPFSFSPFSFVPFNAFSFVPFNFTPFNFTPFGFTPFNFSPFAFTPSVKPV